MGNVIVFPEINIATRTIIYLIFLNVTLTLSKFLNQTKSEHFK